MRVFLVVDEREKKSTTKERERSECNMHEERKKHPSEMKGGGDFGCPSVATLTGPIRCKFGCE